jgi:hypothetical protein
MNLAPNARASSRSLDTSPGHASPRAREGEQHRASCEWNEGICVTHEVAACSTTMALDASNDSTSSSNRRRSSSRAIRGAAGVFSMRAALSTSAINAGMPAWCAERSARARAARASFVRKRRIATPATTSSWKVLDSGGKRLGSRSPSIRSTWSRRPIRRIAGLQDSGQTRRSSGRRARFRPQLLCTWRAASFGLKARPAFRRSFFVRAKSPSCAIAMPRSASADASSRSATRFNAPRGSPDARARAAAVIRASIRIPPHLSLPLLRCPALNITHGDEGPSHIEHERKQGQ